MEKNKQYSPYGVTTSSFTKTIEYSASRRNKKYIPQYEVEKSQVHIAFWNAAFPYYIDTEKDEIHRNNSFDYIRSANGECEITFWQNKQQ